MLKAQFANRRGGSNSRHAAHIIPLGLRFDSLEKRRSAARRLSPRERTSQLTARVGFCLGSCLRVLVSSHIRLLTVGLRGTMRATCRPCRRACKQHAVSALPCARRVTAADACAHAEAPRSRKSVVAIPRVDFRPRVLDVGNRTSVLCRASDVVPSQLVVDTGPKSTSYGRFPGMRHPRPPTVTRRARGGWTIAVALHAVAVA
jgi:hypothetical protein